MKKTKALNNFG